MVTEGLAFRLEVQPGKADDVARFFQGELAGLLDDLPATAWLAVQFEPSSFGLLVTFSEAASENAHIGRRVSEALRDHLGKHVAQTPLVEGFDVIASGVGAGVT